MNKPRWYQFEMTPWRVSLAVVGVLWFLGDVRTGWCLLPVAFLSFYIYSPDQNLELPRPRWIPTVTPVALGVLFIALLAWASDFPGQWYLVPVAILVFFADNQSEQAVLMEKQRYDDSSAEPIARRTGGTIMTEPVQGIIWIVVGLALAAIAFADLIVPSPGAADGGSNLGGRIIFFLVCSALPLFGGIHLILRHFVNKPVTRIMHGESPNQDKLTPEGIAEADDTLDEEVTIEPPVAQTELSGFHFKVIDRLASPANRMPLKHGLNCLGVEPKSMLFLWNFQRTSTHQYKSMLGIEHWQHIGPVYMLSSQSGLPLWRFFKMKTTGSLERAFVHSEEQFEILLKGVDERPRNHGFFSWPGGKRFAFPLHNWLCTSQSWQPAVTRLCDHVDMVILDARGFSSERIGLTWEINHLVDHVSTDRFLVLTDPTTLLDHLRDALRKSWEQMPPDSPNWNAREAVRVLHGIGTMHFENRKRFPEPFHRYEASQVFPLFQLRES